MEEYCLQMQDIKKNFGGVKALKGVSFTVKRGEIHALVGENGAGKSTLMKILSGAYQKDSGSIYIDNSLVDIDSPRKGKETGIGIVYQEFELAKDLTIAENIFLDRLGNDKGIIHWKRLYAEADEVIENLGFKISSKEMVANLSVAYQQVIEIAKVLSANARILILDEPTAVLTPNESEKLFETLINLKNKGVSIIYISHRLEEVFKIADTITTLRDGEVTGSNPKENVDMDKVIELMIGRKISSMFPTRKVIPGDEILRIENLSGGKISNINFTVRRGEVVGLAGLVGSGRTEVARAIFGADSKKAGKIFLEGKEIKIHSPIDSVSKGIGLIPENRKDQGLILEMPIKYNITMSNIKRIRGILGIIKGKKEDRLVEKLVEKLSIKTDSIECNVQKLSGGNQQKVVVAKWFNTDLNVVILDEPTRGVDVGAKVEIYNLINEFAEMNLGIIMISSELAEITGMCDRVIVMDDGKIMGELNKEEVSELNIMKLAVGGERNETNYDNEKNV
ncbi:MAG: transporter-like protein [Clostridiales bacterium]|jgi:ribose transport system ATP-binding protein|nr:transporter-like protein [Clostridiales bacterium]